MTLFPRAPVKTGHKAEQSTVPVSTSRRGRETGGRVREPGKSRPTLLKMRKHPRDLGGQEEVKLRTRTDHFWLSMPLMTAGPRHSGSKGASQCSGFPRQQTQMTAPTKSVALHSLNQPALCAALRASTELRGTCTVPSRGPSQGETDFPEAATGSQGGLRPLTSMKPELWERSLSGGRETATWGKQPNFKK